MNGIILTMLSIGKFFDTFPIYVKILTDIEVFTTYANLILGRMLTTTVNNLDNEIVITLHITL